MDPDLVVVGGGAAALAAARTARRRGATVTMVTDGPPGGDCTWVGCIPSKTLLAAASRGVGFTAAMAQVRRTVDDVAAGEDADHLRAEGIQVVRGTARLIGPTQLAVGPQRLKPRRLILATGAQPIVPPIPGINEATPLTTDDVWALTDRPASLLIVGGGPVGVELSQAFARLGTAVTLIEAAHHLLPAEEPAAAAVVHRALRADGVDVITGTPATGFERVPAGIAVALADGRTATAERLLVAAGRLPRTADLSLRDADIAVNATGHIRTDRHLRTTAKGVWAAGDVTGRAPWTHAADEMGRIAATNALAKRPWRRFHDDRIPSVTYTNPEVARVGMTEAEAASTVPGARVVELPLNEVDRAVTDGRTDGFIKLIVRPKAITRDLAGGRLIGATIVADRAGEMIAVPVLLLATGMFPARVALTPQAYPTWSLGVRQATAKLFTGESRPAGPT